MFKGFWQLSLLHVNTTKLDLFMILSFTHNEYDSIRCVCSTSVRYLPKNEAVYQLHCRGFCTELTQNYQDDCILILSGKTEFCFNFIARPV